jgi:predicted double-glycine peptidase
MRVWRCLTYGLLLQMLVMGIGLAEGGAEEVPRDPVRLPPKRHTLMQLRYQYVLRQQFDYSCGAVALATLMTYYFGDETSERNILDLLKAGLTPDELEVKKKRGFSLLDLRRVAQTKGYQAAGFKLTIEQLKQLTTPVIVFVQPLGYKHFAVLRGIDRGRVFLADPSRGNLRMSMGRFLTEWSGIIFVLDKAREGKETTDLLALPRPDYVQPELLSVGRRVGLETFSGDRAVRNWSLPNH